eukprot:SAG11_NODE_20157_length_451_cov_1.454545_1_plen_57_part_10
MARMSSSTDLDHGGGAQTPTSPSGLLVAGSGYAKRGLTTVLCRNYLAGPEPTVFPIE